MYKKHRLLLFLPLFCCLFSGCIKEKYDPAGIPSGRTVIVYLGAEDFLNEIPEKIEILKNNWDKDINGNLLVYADARERAVLVHIYHNRLMGGNVVDTIEVYPPENSASPATFKRVLNKAKQVCPTASSYGLVVLSHGSGWLPSEMSWPIRLRSVIVDTSTSEAYNYMEIWDFADAIPYKLDFIIFDVCFMGAVEVCYELKDKADYIVASPAEVLAGISWGFVYSTMPQHLFKPVADVVSVAGDFFEHYDKQTGYFRSATVSVVKTDEMEALATVVKDITQQNAPLVNVNNIQTFGFGSQRIYFDLEDYIKKLSPESNDRIKTALEKCVIYKANTPSYYSGGNWMMNPITAFSGLSVYIPQPAYPKANEAYSKLKWAKRIEYSNPF